MNAYYKIYLESTIDLVRSMVIKFEALADAMNRYESELGRTLPLDKSEWRYYKHLTGEYHALDTPMTITSLDDTTTIVFNKVNLDEHKKTRNVYLNNSSYTEALAARYPLQTNLIRGIMHPLEMADVLAAKDGAILYYSSKYVEAQEQRLIPEAEAWVQSFLYRYMMQSFSISDDLFVPTMLGFIYTHLPVKIMGIRYNYIKTAQTHTFHVRQYLASHNRLDEFIQYMTQPQILYLYRNVLYIERHVGQSSTYQDLIHYLMTLRNLPVYDYTLRQKAIDLEAGALSPEPVFLRTPLNLDTAVASRTIDEWPIEEVVYKEVPHGTDNAEYVGEYTEIATSLMKHNAISNIPTKIIQSAAIDPEDLEQIKLIDILINEWVYLAFKGQYTGTASVINPLNGDTWKLNPKELFVLYMYAYMYGFHNVQFDTIPKFHALGLAKLRWIDRSEYIGLVEYDAFGGWEDDIEFFQNTYYEIYNAVTSADDFMDLCVNILKRKRVRHQYVFQPHRLMDRTAREQLYNYSYANILVDCKLPESSTYPEFFLTLGLDAEMLSQSEWADLSMSVLDAATNFDTQNMISLKEIQSAMVRLFKRMSSYTLQFIEEIVSDDSLVLDSNTPIPDNTMESIKANVFIKEEPVVVSETSFVDKGWSDMNVPGIEAFDVIPIIDRTYEIDLHVDAEVTQDTTYMARIMLPLVTVCSVADV